MKNRLYSAIVLVLILGATISLDHALGVDWFSLTLIVVVVAMGARECHVLLGLRELRRRLTPSSHTHEAGLGRVVLTAGGIGLPGVCLVALRQQEQGLQAVLYLIAVAKMTDNGALFVGRLWGFRQLAPAISPAKTIEGVGGGLVTGIVTAILLGPSCTNGRVPFFLTFGLIVGLLAVLGDLAESALKRQAGVKDSGSLLPGIGGMLDLMDSILLSAPAAFVLLAL